VLRLDPGFQTANIVTGLINLPPTRYEDPVKQVAFFAEALRRVSSLPGVQSAAISNSIPLTGINDQGGFRIEGRPAPTPGEDSPQANKPKVSSDYFETMGIQRLEGRSFDQHDTSSAPYVAIVSDLTATKFWPNESPIGKRVSINSSKGKRVWREVVGVVRGTRHFGLEAPQKPEIYFPHTQSPSPFMLLVVRGQIDSASLIAAIRREISAMDPEQSVFAFQSMDDLVSTAGARRRFQMVLLTAFAALAILLAAIGVYGVMQYTVAQRYREIGVRMALGALPREIVSMVLKKGLLLTIAGMAVGCGAAIGLARVMATLLFGVAPLDPLTFGMVGVLVAGVGILATYLPGRRAARIDPVVALRDE